MEATQFLPRFFNIIPLRVPGSAITLFQLVATSYVFLWRRRRGTTLAGGIRRCGLVLFAWLARRLARACEKPDHWHWRAYSAIVAGLIKKNKDSSSCRILAPLSSRPFLSLRAREDLARRPVSALLASAPSKISAFLNPPTDRPSPFLFFAVKANYRTLFHLAASLCAVPGDDTVLFSSTALCSASNVLPRIALCSPSSWSSGIVLGNWWILF